MGWMTVVSTTGEFFYIATSTVIVCCSVWHDNDCYHCYGSGFCGCSQLEQEYKKLEDYKFYSDAMNCWCGACENENGLIHPAPCAQWHWNKMAELSER